MSPRENRNKVHVSVEVVHADVAHEVEQLTGPSTDDKLDVVEVHVTDSTSAATLEVISEAAQRRGADLHLKASDAEADDA